MIDFKKQFIFLLKYLGIFHFLIPLFKRKEKKLLDLTIVELRTVSQMSKAEILKLNNNLLLEILNHANKTTFYYKNLIKSNNININDISSFKTFPLLNKSKIQENKKNLISKKYDFKKLAKRFTGGSTGQPMEFYADKNAMIKDHAHHYYLNELIGINSEDITIGIYGRKLSEEQIQKKIFYTKSPSVVFGHYQFSSLALNDFNIDKFIEQLFKFKPSIIRGYPSTLNSLATYIIEKEIIPDFKIKGIVLTSEFCSKQQRLLIEIAFKTTVYFEYGNKEINIFCLSKGNNYLYHSSPIYSYVEVLNQDGSDTAIGEIGNIVTTGYNNYGMPFIRYETGDLGRLASRNGGTVTFSEIIGRSQDYLIDANGNKKYLIANIYSHKIPVFKKIQIWQLRQNLKGIVNVVIVPLKEFSEQDKIEIMIPFKKFENFEFNFVYVKEIPKTKIGKHMFVVQKILTD